MGADFQGRRIYLMPGRVLFLGVMPDLPQHRHAAAAMIFGCTGRIQVRAPRGDWRDCHSVLIPPFAYHATRSGNQAMGVLFQEPGDEMFRRLALTRDFIFEPPEFDGALEGLRAFAGQPEDASRLEQALHDTKKPEPNPREVDPRITEIIQLIENDPEAAPGVEELGRRIGVSGSRLIHLFSGQTGTTLRRFRGWHRMKIAARELSANADLTTAAHAAGFFDSAHFSRAFRNMFGLPPSEVFRPDTTIQLQRESVSLHKENNELLREIRDALRK